MASPFLAFTQIPPSAFNGRANAINLVCNQLAASEFRSTALVGGPYTGKTSLLQYLASQKAQADHPLLKQSWNIYISGDLIGSTATPAHFWASCFREIQRQVDPGDLKDDVAKMAERTRQGDFDIFHLEDFLDKCYDENQKLVLFIDDFVNLLRNANFWPPSDFFHQVRNLAHRVPRTLAFVVGTPRPVRELWDSSKNASPFYNSLLSVSIGRLTESEAKELVKGGFAALNLELSPEIEGLVIEASDCHPSLVNYVADLCANMKANGAINMHELYEAFSDPNGPVVDLIRRIREELNRTEREWVDIAKANPEKLTEVQRVTLRKLWDLGLIQPGVKIQ